MPAKRFTVEQIIRILAEAELPSMSNAAVARKYGISQQTLYRWRKKYRGLSSSEARRLKVLEEENRRLKRLLAEKEWFRFYNEERPHSALGYRTPAELYRKWRLSTVYKFLPKNEPTSLLHSVKVVLLLSFPEAVMIGR